MVGITTQIVADSGGKFIGFGFHCPQCGQTKLLSKQDMLALLNLGALTGRYKCRNYDCQHMITATITLKVEG